MSHPGMPSQRPGQYPGEFPPLGQPGQPTYPPAYGQPQRGPEPSAQVQRDAEAAWQTRLELGADFEREIAAGLAERVEELALQRTRELRAQAEEQRLARRSEDFGGGRQLALGIVSVVMGVPITAITGPAMDQGILPIIVAWAGIVGVNFAHARSLRRSRRSINS